MLLLPYTTSGHCRLRIYAWFLQGCVSALSAAEELLCGLLLLGLHVGLLRRWLAGHVCSVLHAAVSLASWL